MALFLGRGFVAWMRAWTQATPKPEGVECTAHEPLSLPGPVHGQMVSALAGMVLDTLRKEVA